MANKVYQALKAFKQGNPDALKQWNTQRKEGAKRSRKAGRLALKKVCAQRREAHKYYLKTGLKPVSIQPLVKQIIC